MNGRMQKRKNEGNKGRVYRFRKSRFSKSYVGGQMVGWRCGKT